MSNLDESIYDPKFRRPFADETKLPTDLVDDKAEFPIEITWVQHIRGLFTENNARCMMSKNINLSSYESVQSNAPNIYGRVSSKNPKEKMPPGDPWNQYQINLFGKWKDNPLQFPTNPVTGKEYTPEDFEKVKDHYFNKTVDAPLRYQYPETLPVDFIATFYQNIKPMFTTCDQKMARDKDNDPRFTNYQIDVFNYDEFTAAAKNQGQTPNIVSDILNDKFPRGNPWPKTWKNVLNNWIDNDYKQGEPPIGKEAIS